MTNRLQLDDLVYLVEDLTIEVRQLEVGDRFVHEENIYVVCFSREPLGNCESGDRVYYQGKWRVVWNSRGVQPLLLELEDSSTPFSLPKKRGEFECPDPDEDAMMLCIEACLPTGDGYGENNLISLDLERMRRRG